MENYIQELVEICKLPFDEIGKGYKLILLNGRGVYVCNYKKIIDYSSEKVVLKVHNNTLEISGENLQLNLVNKGEIVIVGKIFSFGIGVTSEKSKDKK